MRTVGRTEILRRVAEGTALLDRRFPGWAKKVDPDRLCLDLCDECPLGLMFGDYETGLRKLWRDPLKYEVKAIAHGFTLPWSSEPADWDTLDAAWRHEIAARREKGAPLHA